MKDDTPSLDAPVDDWLVHADSLQQRGDPRGELIALSCAGDEAARDAHVAAHAEALLGGAARYLDRLEIDWRFSLAAELTVSLQPGDGPAAGAIVRAALTSPPCRTLGALTIAVETAGAAVDASGAIDALDALPASCRRLSLVDARARRAEMLVSREFWCESLVSFGSLERLWSLPIEDLTIDVAIGDELVLGVIDAPTLRRLAIRPLLFSEPDALLTGARWPRLEDLELRLGETFVANWPVQVRPYVALEDYMELDEVDDELREHDAWGDSVEHPMGPEWGGALPAFLRELHQTALRRLALTSFGSDEVLLASIAAAGLPPSVRELSFAHASLHPESVDWMLEHASLLAQLERLDLSDTSLTEGDVGRLADLGIDIVHSHYAHAPRFRFVAGQE